jgi:HAD superfamily hydrolase (TIGR01509 family)
MRKYEAVIFDLDGTLVDSMWVWDAIDIEFLDERGFKVPEDLQDAIEGMSFTETAQYFKERFELKEEIDSIKDVWNDMARHFYRDKVKLKQGAREYLEKLKKQGVKLAVGTSNSRELALATLEGNGVLHFFDIIMTSCEVDRGKPYPDIFLGVAKKLQIKPDKCLVHEDTLAGVKAGVGAGMDVIGIYDSGSHEKQDEIEKLTLEIVKNYNKFID